MNYADKLKHPIFKVASQIVTENNLEAYVIGGFVRDLFLDRPNKDIDIVVIGNGLDLAQKCAEKLRVKKVSTFERFGTAQFVYKGIDVEFVGARKESYRSDSRKPSVENGTLQDDQNRRDFTINAMALDLRAEHFGNLLDPFNGIEDLKKGILRTPLEPEKTYSDDPLRMMRAIRFATQLDFKIDIHSLEAIKDQAKRLEIVSMERISIELNKIILSNKPSRGFMLLQSTQLLKFILPELEALMGVETKQGKSHKDNFLHTLEVLDNVAEVSDDLWLRWAAILHDIAKAPTKRFDPEVGWTFHGHEELGARMTPRLFKRLKLPMDHKMKFVQKLVRLHLRPISLVKDNVSDSAIRRLLFEAGDDIESLMTLCNADITSKNEMKVKKFKKNFDQVMLKLKQIEEKDHVRNFQPPISGEEIMNLFELPPCSIIGELKNQIKEAILEGKIENCHSSAYTYLIEIAEEKGIKVGQENNSNNS